MGIPQNGGFIGENPIKMDYWGVPLFQETSIYIYIYIHFLERCKIPCLRYAYDRFEPVSERFLLEGEKKKAVGILSFASIAVDVLGMSSSLHRMILS